MRSCGDCIACCVYLRIDEIEKPGMTHCGHLELYHPPKANELQYTGPSQAGNCTVHGTDKRPACCEDYYCAWRQGYGLESDRPDKSLLLFDRCKRIENSLEAKPLADGAESTAAGMATVDRMSRDFGAPVIVLSFYERRIRRIAGRPV